MPTSAAVLATRYAGRPVLMLPRAAQEIAEQLHALDPRAFERPSGLRALFRGLRGAQARRQPVAMEDDYDGPPPVPFHERAAYVPLYIGEPEDLGYCWALKEGVALMQVNTPFLEEGEEFCGTVYHGYDTLLAGLRDAAADGRVKAVFLRMSSPGGPVSHRLSELSAWMRANRGEAGGKPIHVYAAMACSAGFWAAAPADKIWAPDVGLVASIGCVLPHYNYSGAMEKAGVEIDPIQFGKKKTDGAWWAALSPAARADLQAEIDQCGRNFVSDVAKSRPKLTEEALLATEAGVFLAAHDENERSGLALGFVDEISGEEAAFAALAAQVSDPQSTGLVPLAAPGGRAASKLTENKPMALRPTPNAAVQAAEAALATAQANLDRVRAAATAESGAETSEAEADAPGSEDPDPAAAEAPAEEPDPDEDEEDKPEAGAEASAKAERDKILSSAEAQANPNLALAAVRDGLTYAQFKGQVDASASAPRRGALREAMAGARRLGPDAGGKGQSVATSPLVQSAQRMAAEVNNRGR